MSSTSTLHEFVTRAAVTRHNPYGYTPTLAICVLFVVLFGISTAIHLGQAVRYRLWWLLPTAVLAGLGEVIGWAGRTWSSQNVTARDPFLMQITSTIIAPTPLVAANFIILGQLIVILGPRYSRIGPRLYAQIFLTCDLLALVVQSIGGAKASQAAANNQNPAVGGHIMLAGIAIQLVTIAIYTALASEFVWRYASKRPIRAAETSPATTPSSEDTAVSKQQARIGGNARLMLFGLCLSTVVIFIRSVYRVIELSDGWGGRIITTERYFAVLDGGMITIAMFTLNVFHPGRLLAAARPERFDSESKHYENKAGAQIRNEAA